MKNEKFCFNKATGLIALVGILLVGSVLVSQTLTNTKTSTNSRASAPKAPNKAHCGYIGMPICSIEKPCPGDERLVPFQKDKLTDIYCVDKYKKFGDKISLGMPNYPTTARSGNDKCLDSTKAYARNKLSTKAKPIDLLDNTILLEDLKAYQGYISLLSDNYAKYTLNHETIGSKICLLANCGGGSNVLGYEYPCVVKSLEPTCVAQNSYLAYVYGYIPNKDYFDGRYYDPYYSPSNIIEKYLPSHAFVKDQYLACVSPSSFEKPADIKVTLKNKDNENGGPLTFNTTRNPMDGDKPATIDLLGMQVSPNTEITVETSRYSVEKKGYVFTVDMQYYEANNKNVDGSTISSEIVQDRTYTTKMTYENSEKARTAEYAIVSVTIQYYEYDSTRYNDTIESTSTNFPVMKTLRYNFKIKYNF